MRAYKLISSKILLDLDRACHIYLLSASLFLFLFATQAIVFAVFVVRRTQMKRKASGDLLAEYNSTIAP